jgi:drug/metabolite transporter (DMT)-like permease
MMEAVGTRPLLYGRRMTLSTATLAGLLAILLWGLLALFTASTAGVPPFQLAAMTFAIAGLGGLAFGALRGRLSALRQPARVWAVGVGGLFGYHACYFAALKLAPPAAASLIAYLWPLLMVLFSGLLPGERLRPRHVLGAGLGLMGVAALAFGGEGGLRFEAGHLAGYGLALACAFIWSGYSVLSRVVGEAPTDAVTGFCLATAALSAGAHLALETTVLPSGVGTWLAVVALGVGPVGAAFFLWDHGTKRGDLRFLAVASYAAPVISTVALIAAGRAEPTPALLLACGLIVGGAAVASWRGR